MKLLLEKLRPFGFNVRRLHESDLLEICDRGGITVRFDTTPRAFYLGGVITIPARYRGLRREFAIAHELTHHLYHVCGASPKVIYFEGIDKKSKEEIEADAMATIALMPDPAQALDNSRFAREVKRERDRLRFLYQL